MPEHPRKSAKKKATAKTTASPVFSVSAKKVMKTRKKAFAMPMVEPPEDNRRLPLDERDLTEPDDIEIWMAEQLRDWQLAIGAQTLGQIQQVLEAMLSNAKEERADVKNDLRKEGYLEGQINVLETILQQIGRAVAARKARVGEAVMRGV